MSLDGFEIPLNARLPSLDVPTCPLYAYRRIQRMFGLQSLEDHLEHNIPIGLDSPDPIISQSAVLTARMWASTSQRDMDAIKAEAAELCNVMRTRTEGAGDCERMFLEGLRNALSQ